MRRESRSGENRAPAHLVHRSASDTFTCACVQKELLRACISHAVLIWIMIFEMMNDAILLVTLKSHAEWYPLGVKSYPVVKVRIAGNGRRVGFLGDPWPVQVWGHQTVASAPPGKKLKWTEGRGDFGGPSGVILTHFWNPQPVIMSIISLCPITTSRKLEWLSMEPPRSHIAPIYFSHLNLLPITVGRL